MQGRAGQARFRESVLDAYASRCILCRLRHRELLDAAHIVSYAEVRDDVFREEGGPMLRHGLHEVHGVRIHLPRSPAMRPSAEGLERGYERFRGRV